MSGKRKAPPQHHRTVLASHPNRQPKKRRTTVDSDRALLAPAPLPPLPTAPTPHYLRFSGSKLFRFRLLSATLSSTPLIISSIRSSNEEPGLKDYEVSFLRLIEAITTGSVISINETGTAIKYHPGTLTGGRPIPLTHACPPSRGVGYYLMPLISLSPFMSSPLTITLTGCTHHPLDPSTDLIRAITLPLSSNFLPSPPTLQVTRRAFSPLGEGSVTLTCTITPSLKPINLTSPGLIRRIRGTALTSRCPPSHTLAAIHSARGIANRLIPDVHVYADVAKGKGAGPSPGWSLTLVAESTTGVLKGREVIGGEGKEGEGVGVECAGGFMGEVERGGCVDGLHDAFVLFWMVLTPSTVSRVRLGRLSSQAVDVLRLCERVWGVKMQVEGEEAGTVLVTGMGSGYENVNRRVT